MRQQRRGGQELVSQFSSAGLHVPSVEFPLPEGEASFQMMFGALSTFYGGLVAKAVACFKPAKKKEAHKE